VSELAFGERVMLLDAKKRRYLLTLKEGGEFHSHAGFVPHSEVAGPAEGVTRGAADLEAVFDVPVQVSAVLGRARMDFGQLLQLELGRCAFKQRGQRGDVLGGVRLQALDQVPHAARFGLGDGRRLPALPQRVPRCVVLPAGPHVEAPPRGTHSPGVGPSPRPTRDCERAPAAGIEATAADFLVSHSEFASADEPVAELCILIGS